MNSKSQQVFKVNRGWIVRDTLADTAEAYLEHLRLSDLPRFNKTIAVTYGVIRHISTTAWGERDPKSFFYPAVFFFITKVEVTRFLTSHHFTRAAVAFARNEPELDHLDWPAPVSSETRQTIVERASFLRDAANNFFSHGISEQKVS
jgi:hypothetical protein